MTIFESSPMEIRFIPFVNRHRPNLIKDSLSIESTVYTQVVELQSVPQITPP